MKMTRRNTPGRRPTGPKMLFKSWFIGLLNTDPRVKPHHYETIRLFFKGLGISELEDKETYKKALESYFGV
jgi:hypothetical protein